jgi:acyl carrier protein
MTRDDIRRALLNALTEIAPEVDADALEAGKPLRRQVDLDSADWLNFLVAVHESLGVDISDAEAAKLTTLDLLIDHCARALQV